MKYISLLCLIPMLACSSSSNEGEAVSDSQRREAEWVSLFNGEDLSGWIIKISKHELNDNYGNTFRVEDGLLKVRYDQYPTFDSQFGHIYYHNPFSKYHLKLEYRFTGDYLEDTPGWARMNSGVMFHSQDPATVTVEQDFPISVEAQFLGGLGDGNPRPTGNMCSPGTEIYYEGEMYGSHCLNSTSSTYPKDEWVSAELIVLGDSLITHIINGDTVLQYSNPMMGGGVVNNFDSSYWEAGKRLTSGFIALQSEGQPIDFRNIQILNLEED